jgi:tetratricopeptide (TPR) repeat protein
MNSSVTALTSTALILLAACLALNPPAYSTSLRHEPDDVIGFANMLLNEGDAYRAISEYQAFLFFFPRHPRRDEAVYYMGKAYQMQRQWQEALRAFGQLINNKDLSTNTWAQMAAMEFGRTLSMAGRLEHAARAFEEMASRIPLVELKGKALFEAARVWMRAGNWERALRAIERIPPSSTNFGPAKSLGQRIKDEVPHIPRRSPTLAGIMSAAVPGMGHLYVGEYKDALTSFLLNAAFIAGTVIAAREGYPVLSGIMAFFEFGWYAGGIISSARRAAKFNRRQEALWTEETLRRFPSD